MKKHTITASVLFLGLLFLSWPGYLQSGDNALSIATADALVNDGSFLINDFSQEKPENQSNAENRKKSCSRFGIGLPFLYVPIIYLEKFISLFINKDIARNILFSSVSPVFGILNFYIIVYCLRRLGLNTQKAYLIALLSSVFTLNFRYSVHDHSEIIQSTILLASVAFHLSDRKHKNLYISILLSYGVMIKTYNIAIYFIFFICIAPNLIKTRRFLKETAYAFFPILFTISIILILNYVRYGSPFETGYGKEALSFSFENFGKTFIPLIISFEMGFLTFNPLLIVAFIGVAAGIRNGNRIAQISTLVTLFLFSLSAFHSFSKGGWALGPRYIVPSISLLALGFAFLDFSKRAVRYTTALLLIPAVVLSVIFVLEKTQEYDVVRYELDQLGIQAPSQIIGLVTLLKLKSTGYDRYYPASAFSDSRSEKMLDLRTFDSFQGVNTWYNHFSSKFGHPITIPLLAIHIFLFFATTAYVINLLLFHFKELEER